jgi:hypothetical protein
LRIATLSTGVRHDLETAVSSMANQTRIFLSTSSQPHPRLESLVESLGVSADKLSRCEGPLHELRLHFGLASRFYLEAHGYINYWTTYLPRLASAGRPTVDKNLIGVLTKDEGVCTDYLRMGVPVWLLRHGSALPRISDHEDKSSQPRIYQDRVLCPKNAFSDIGIVQTCLPLLYTRPINTAALLEKIDAWAEKKLVGSPQ